MGVRPLPHAGRGTKGWLGWILVFITEKNDLARSPCVCVLSVP